MNRTNWLKTYSAERSCLFHKVDSWVTIPLNFVTSTASIRFKPREKQTWNTRVRAVRLIALQSQVLSDETTLTGLPGKRVALPVCGGARPIGWRPTGNRKACYPEQRGALQRMACRLHLLAHTGGQCGLASFHNHMSQSL